jgi:hypothetical protein
VTEYATGTVPGVPVAVQAAAGVLTVVIGRFDPGAASGMPPPALRWPGTGHTRRTHPADPHAKEPGRP